ncbi:MAG: ATP-binding protein [Gemmatimonadota bacterium]|nr:ATP-binding protein [Gemmatimonadota bacterium]
MRLRIHHVLFAGFFGVVGLLTVLTLVLVGTGLDRELGATFRAELERQLILGRGLMARSGDMDPDALARAITERIDYRVTIIDTTGVVRGESYLEPGRLGEMESHRQRPEVRAVLEGEEDVAFDERVSATVEMPLLYAATLGALNTEPMILRIAAPRTEVEQAVDRVQRAVAAAGLLAMLVALTAAYLLSRLFARPLVALADHARRLARGDFSGSVRAGPVSELRDVAVAFNRLSDELRGRLAELGEERDEMQVLIDCMAEGVIALTDDGRLLRTNRTARAMLRLPDPSGTSERPPLGAVVRHRELREVLEASLRGDVPSREIEVAGRHVLVSSRALDRGGAVTTLLDVTEIRRLETVRRDFVANASHEIKTPLTSIRGYAESLVEDDPPEDVRRRFLEAIHTNTVRLQNLVDDLLDLSRLESGGWSAGSEHVDIGRVARDTWTVVEAAAGTSAIDFEVDGEAVAVADPQGLAQVFRNLFENAIRHTGGRGTVHVRVRPAAEGLVAVDVSDDGEGIPVSVLPRIFERFYRADASRARDAGGTGLGLAIVKHLVGAMGGSVEAESELGRGTTIRFTLPAP